ncbi:MAG: ADYC domain-containing protein [Pseudomonadota bacterium]|nr:ADYC domain-containing protein [Pseudomonadota bacterium]
MRTLIQALLLTSACLLSITVSAGDGGGLRVEGTRFVVPDASGKLLSGADLAGAELDLGEVGVVRVVAVEQDTSARFNEVWLHSLTLRQPGSMVFNEFCAPDAKGDTRVVVYPGYFDEALHYVADAERFSFSCVSGVEAKCLRWGYLPWRKAPNSGASLAPYYETCIKLARADYLGDGQASTRDGAAIDIYDHIGVQQPTTGLDKLHFEAGWNLNGAVCVHHTRIPENLTLGALRQRLAPRSPVTLGDACSESLAQSQGALLFNRSTP